MVMMGLFFGITFYAAKLHRPVLYGSIEILAGGCGLVLVAFFAPVDSVLALVFGIASSIYIIVRGLTNINDALLKLAELPSKTVVASDVIKWRRRLKVVRPPVRTPLRRWSLYYRR